MTEEQKQQRIVTAGIVEAGRDQPLHAQLAHIAERHRRPGGVLGWLATSGLSCVGGADRHCFGEILNPVWKCIG
jgi:hypothetical protein